MKNESTLDYKDFLSVLKRGKWLILLLTVVTTLLVGAISYYLIKSDKSVYQTSTSVIVGKKEDIVNAKDYIDTYKEIASSYNVAKNTSVALNGSMSTQEVQKAYSVTATAGDPILKISSSGRSPKESMDISNAVFTSFSGEVKRIYPNETLEIMENSVQTNTSSSRTLVRNVVLAALLGLFLSIFIVTFIGYFDTKIRTRDDVEKYLDLPVIGERRSIR